MTHLFDNAKTEFDKDSDFWLCLRVKNRPMARQFVKEMQQGCTYDAEIKLHRNKRSLDANAYAWVLMSKLADVLQKKKEDIYRELITGIGDNFEIVAVQTEAADKFIEGWKHNGIGWVCEKTGSSAMDGYENIIAYYGSSTYNTKQMSRLIDLIVQECHIQGIETATPQELARYKENWRNHG